MSERTKLTIASLILIGGLAAMSAFAEEPAVQQEQKTYTLTVTEAELNVIGQAIGELPYRVSAPILAKLQQQIQMASKKEKK